MTVIKTRSFKFKLMLTILLVVFLAIFIIFSFSTFFLQKYYLYRQKNEFAKTYNEASEVFNSKNADILGRLSDISSNANINMMISDIYFENIYASTNLINNSHYANDIKDVLKRMYNSVEIVPEKGYGIKVFDFENSGSMLVLIGKLDNDYLIYLTKPIIPMIRSVAIYQEFILYLSILVGCFGAVAAYILSNRFSKPINELVEISQKISNLDFSSKYTPKGNSDINQLGIALNVMSEKLSENVFQLYKANTILKNDLTQKERNEKMRKEFLQNASHELKTPIAVIASYSEMLKDKIITDEEDCDYYYNVIYDETEKMGRIVKQLLVLAQFESRSEMLNIEKFNFSELVEDVITTYDIIGKKENINIISDIEMGLYASADMLMIEQVVSNYISNAIYHVYDDDKIYVELKKVPDGIYFGVKNRTSGLIDSEKIWSSFYKGETSHGNGLGLSIVKAIMDSHNKKYGMKCQDGFIEFYILL